MSKPNDVAETIGVNRSGWSRSRILVVVALVVIAVGAVWLWTNSGGDDQQARYITQRAERGEIVVTVTATGTVEPTNLVEISSELSGTVAKVHVDHNAEVMRGQVLAELDDAKLTASMNVLLASLQSAEARIEIARANLQDAQARLDSAIELDRRGVTAQETLRERQTAYQRTLAELSFAQADRQLAQANLARERAELDDVQIVSPINGVVLERSVDPGQIVAAAFSAPVLFTLAEDLREMELRVAVDEADIGRVAIGQKAIFTVDAYDEMEFPAEISELRFAPEIVDGVVTYQAILTIDNTDMLLRPGMTATADIVIAEIEDALLVPNAALRFQPPADAGGSGGEDRSGLLGMLMPNAQPQTDQSEQGRAVWVLENGVPKRVTVERGDTDGSMTEVRSGELSDDTPVITDLADG